MGKAQLHISKKLEIGLGPRTRGGERKKMQVFACYILDTSVINFYPLNAIRKQQQTLNKANVLSGWMSL